MNRQGNIKLIISICAGYVPSMATAALMTFIIGALMDGMHINESYAGLICTLEASGIAASLLMFAPIIPKFNRRRLVIYGLVLAGIGHFVSSIHVNYVFLAVLRFMVGMAEGMAIAAANAVIAESDEPEGIFAWVLFSYGVILAILIKICGYLSALWGYSGIFMMTGTITFIGLLFVKWLPGKIKIVESRKKDHRKTNVGHGILSSASGFILNLSFFALVSFLERIALNNGITTAQTGSAVSTALFLGLFGALFAGWLGTRIGRLIPILFSYALVGTSLLLMTYSWSFLYFTIIVVLNAIFFKIAIVFTLGTAASLDRQGRWLVTVNGLILIGMAIAPFTGGVIISFFGYHALRWIVFLGVISGLAMFIPVVRHLDRNSVEINERDVSPTEMIQNKDCATT